MADQVITMTCEEVYGQSVRDPQIRAELAAVGGKVNGLVLIWPPGALTPMDPGALQFVAVSRKRKRSTRYVTDVGRFVVHIDFESAKYNASDENAADFLLWFGRLLSPGFIFHYLKGGGVKEICEELRKRIASAVAIIISASQKAMEA
jgi:hypothetical protein